jgi:hypothetical protein
MNARVPPPPPHPSALNFNFQLKYSLKVIAAFIRFRFAFGVDFFILVFDVNMMLEFVFAREVLRTCHTIIFPLVCVAKRYVIIQTIGPGKRAITIWTVVLLALVQVGQCALVIWIAD